MSSRTLAIGDIHGCDIALDTLLAKAAPTRDDTLVILGDVIDRGPGSNAAVQQLLNMSLAGRMVLVLGNHEEMMLGALQRRESTSELTADDWLRYGGHETVVSYGGRTGSIPAEHLDFLAAGRDYWETETDIFIHANLEPGVDLAEQSPAWLRWTHLTGFEQPHDSGKRVICGHTPQRSGRPLVFPGWVCIDTLAFAAGWLTALDVSTGEIFQANQAGKSRTSWLPG